MKWVKGVPARWKIWIDREGTFTANKLLSENPGHYEDAAVEAVRRLTGGSGEPIELRLWTTVAANGHVEDFGPVACSDLAVDDVLTTETPGDGGFGDRP